ncbi:UPF0481 protein At3g47200-like [Cornus florida]|uniref:UPF0481 protein At3g47200-like n=1 Tax=Cornus florida TaxID=4283 RepID=UPI0028A20766|nr:UPF0481 protein At3g47200-like [Cornus florida]
MPLERGESSSFTQMTFFKLMNSLEKKIKENKENFEALGNFEHAWPMIPIIKRVPNMLREENEKAYTPSVVSIGPLHCEDENLQAMKADKLSYMLFLFRRAGKDSEQKKREDCAEATLKMKSTFTKCYADHLAKLDENVIINLAEMMLIDGCFIIELLYRHYKREKDPILQDPFRYNAIRRDLLLLENQIPFSVLEKLFSLMVQGNPSPTLIECLLSFFGDIMGLEDGNITKNKNTPPPLHILHLFHICYQPEQHPAVDASSRLDHPPSTSSDHEWQATRREGLATQPAIQRVLRATFCQFGFSLTCYKKQPREDDGSHQEQWDNKLAQPGYEGTATQLDIAGIKLRKRTKTNLFDVEFRPQDSCFYFWRGCLEIPSFSVYNFTESFLRNLIAFEQCCPWFESFFTSHAFLMDILIDSVEDVKLLEKEGIICNHLGSSESVVQIFNGICKNAIPQHFHYRKEWRKMKRCCTSWREQLGTVTRNCAGNLWIVLSVIGALVLFVLTLLQTIYAIGP